ncbi:DNA-processing protein DprA [Alicyclobacillus sp. SP_1]|uniref:DNA-processing protein DprA n=1 Tax=Alicyclobacillus sp. SP_1 TaxID=2942475 RepID=UPI0021579F1D|nr:DNA-processing protein DprA [Alicyclobacillus sp. SP_1]
MEEDILKLLMLAPALAPSLARRLVREYGCGLAVWTAEETDLVDNHRVMKDVAKHFVHWRRQADLSDWVDPLANWGVRMLTLLDDDYPQALRELPDRPIGLFVRGNCRLGRNPVVSVVGTRRASPYGMEAARWIGSTLAQNSVDVVSGMALGIDGAAHRAALESGGYTVAVLGTCIQEAYPPSHRVLYESICASGCCVSEYGPNRRTKPYYFLERNRLIAALCQSLILVQAGDKSGALTTTEYALGMGKEIYVVPGPITSAHFRGSNQLLYDGARPLVDPQDLLKDLGIDNSWSMRSRRTLPESWEALLGACVEPLGAEDLAAILDWPVQNVYAILLEAELAGYVQRLPGARYCRNSEKV